jgi:hypothetical protein
VERHRLQRRHRLVLKQKGHKRLDAADGDEEQGRPIFFVAPRDVLAVVRAWYEHCGEPAADTDVVRDIFTEDESYREKKHDEKKALQADLKASGVTRAILFSTAKTVEAIRFHDGRATFATWAKRAGKEPAWIKDRTGWSPTSEMIDRYTRMAGTLADLNYRPFPDVTRAIPELAEAAENWARLATEPVSTIPTDSPEASQVPVTPGCEGRDLKPNHAC